MSPSKPRPAKVRAKEVGSGVEAGMSTALRVKAPPYLLPLQGGAGLIAVQCSNRLVSVSSLGLVVVPLKS